MRNRCPRAARVAALGVVVAWFGAPDAATQVVTGRAQADPGEPKPPAIHVVYMLQGHADGDRFGTAIATLPDLDGDSHEELLIGAPNRKSPGYSTIGHAYVHSGRTGEPLREHLGWSKGDRFGHSVARLPDLDGDGVEDYGVGAIWAVNVEDPDGAELPGSVAFLSGATGETLAEWSGTGVNECFGSALGIVSDLDGDGTRDVMVGVRLADGLPDGGAVEQGQVRLVSATTGAVLAQSAGELPGDRLGSVAVLVGDQDDDGHDDVIVGASNHASGSQRGMVRVISGTTAQTLAEFVGIEDGERYGVAIAAIPDLDGDGREDVVIGAPEHQAQRGRVEVVSAASGQTLFSMLGPAPGEAFGIAVAPAGDRDGDGLHEIAVGASLHGHEQGRVLIVSTVTGEVLATMEGTTNGLRLGESLLLLPDLTGDGRPELAVGAPLYPLSTFLGRLYVVSID